MLSKTTKQKTIKENKRHENDTGSPEVQASLLSEKIDELADHLKSHPKDNHSRRGLLGMVSDRRSIMNYIKKKDSARHEKISKKLGLKIK